MNAMEITFLIAVAGVCTAMVASAFPPFSWMGQHVAPAVGIAGLATAMVGAVVGVTLWLF
ncbi:hypothetical protein LCGC14_1420990 [marine sediment metagenome]|uniref:Uncharacterized protein n=1 Tax=marine sediment metagenome TaxID=412755 RepID=A0A0F9JR66_9ZZZZ